MQENRPILTIAIPTYNGSKTISNMLNILLPQCDNKVEIIVSDNCSTDDTPQIIAEYRKKYPCIKMIRNEKNIGADGNFLQCMLQASGKYTMLISDDDIIVEDAISKIVSFLTFHPEVSLAYLDSVAFKDNYVDVASCHSYSRLRNFSKSYTTTDKTDFFSCCERLFGFTSSFVWSTQRIHEIEYPQKYFNTYFLQAYMCIRCSDRPDDVLGLIHGPCVAIGEYGIIGNYDVALVEGVFYHKMMEEAIQCGYPRDQFEKWYEWKLCFLCRNAIIKEKAVNQKRTTAKSVFVASIKHPRTWLRLYPLLLLPRWFCCIVLSIVRKKQGRQFASYVNRPTE